MESKSKVLRKILVLSIALAMTAGTGISTSAGSFINTNMSVNAASAYSYGDFKYTVNNDTVTITKYSGTDTEVAVPKEIDGKTVTSIGEYAFYGNTEVTSVTLPDSITSIGLVAFQGCTALTDINIPYGVTSIDNQAFGDCTQLTDIVIPDSVTHMGMNVFLDCTGLKNVTLSNSLTILEESLFDSCTGLTNITIPDSVTEIGRSTFQHCTSLTSIEIPTSVNYIGDNAFAFCSGLTEFTIPDGITVIRETTFYGCTGLTKVTIPDSVTEMESRAFAECKSLTNIKIPDGVTKIENYAFEYCYALKNVIIPDGVTDIGDGAFRYCTSMTRVIIPNSVTYISDIAFEHCTSLISVNIPNSVTYMGYSVFTECSSLKSVNIPNSIAGLEGGSFRYCTSLTNVSVPDGIEYIDFEVFYGCSSLKTVSIPKSVTNIEKDSFYECISLTDIIVDPENTVYSSQDGVVFNKDKTMLIIYPFGKQGHYHVPEGVTEIDFGAFAECRVLKTVTFSDTLKSVQDGSFYNCTNLTSMIVPNNVSYMGNWIAENCPKLTLYGQEDSYAEHYVYMMNYIPFKPLKFFNTSSISANRIKPGETVTVNAKTSDAEGNYTYAVLYRKTTDSKWTVKQNYNSNSNISIKPSSSGIYEICVKAKDESGHIEKQYFTVEVSQKLKNNSELSATEITLGDTITTAAQGTGGTGNYTYAVLYKKKSDTKWTVKQNYKANGIVNIKPAHSVEYDVCIKVKDSDGTIVKKYFTVKVNKTTFVNNSTVSDLSITLGNTAEIKASATGGTTPYSYAVYTRKSQTVKWTENQAYSTNTTVNFKPTEKGTYEICVKVKDKLGTIEKKYLTVTVK